MFNLSDHDYPPVVFCKFEEKLSKCKAKEIVDSNGKFNLIML